MIRATVREIVLDTETTGLDPSAGHRVIEIGCVELLNHVRTGRTFHTYVNPERDMPTEAERVHGITAAFLADKPRFGEIAADFSAFIGGDTLVIHNAAFDVKFLNAELGRLDGALIENRRVVDTLDIARRRFPGAAASLDSLCRRFGVDLSGRTLHGALLDAELLACVYLELLGGREPALLLEDKAGQGLNGEPVVYAPIRPRPDARPILLTPEERAAHAAFLQALPVPALWGQT